MSDMQERWRSGLPKRLEWYWKIKPFTLREFVRESNRIEGIATVRVDEVEAHRQLIDARILIRPSIERFAQAVTCGHAPLRSEIGMDVRVGTYRPPRGGPAIAEALDEWIWADHRTPFEAHIAFEKLHPFMDGNGRTGRALWLWQMGGIEYAPLGFLRSFYYQSLEAAQCTPSSEKQNLSALNSSPPSTGPKA